MVRLLACALISTLALTGCGGNKNPSDSNAKLESDKLYEKVLALHDTIMIDWTLIQKLQVELNDPMDSAVIALHDSLITTTKTNLNTAYEFMHRWMEDFAMPEKQTGESAKVEYFKNQLTLLNEMQLEMKAAIEQAHLCKAALAESKSQDTNPN